MYRYMTNLGVRLRLQMDMIRITINYGYGYRLITGAAPPSGDVTSNPQTCGCGKMDIF